MTTIHVLRLENIYLVDCSWTSTSIFNGFGKIVLARQTQLLGTNNKKWRESTLHSELKTPLGNKFFTSFDMLTLCNWVQRFYSDYKGT